MRRGTIDGMALVVAAAPAVVAGVFVIMFVTACARSGAPAQSSSDAHPPVATRSLSSAAVPTAPSPTVAAPGTAVPAAGSRVPSVTEPAIVWAPIPYTNRRRAQTAAYSLRHYGRATTRLDPKVIVLHFTAGSTYAAARAVFTANAPHRGELPGVSTHFVVDKDGTIYQLLPTDVCARHAIGLNWCAIGIEMVQETGVGAHWADRQILHRPAQVEATLRLVAWLQAKYGIAARDVVGHAMANGSPYFNDLQGWRNDHTDWQAADVREFRARLAALR